MLEFISEEPVKESENAPKATAEQSPENEQEQNPIAEEPPKAVKEKPTTAKIEKVEGKKVLAEQFQSKTGIVAEKTETVTDIRKAISVMDRFLYMKELFGNSQETFNDALDAINKSANLQEAVEYLSQFNWEDNETSQQFMRLLTRRFN